MTKTDGATPEAGGDDPQKSRSFVWKLSLFLILVAVSVMVAVWAPVEKLHKAAEIRQYLQSWGGWAYAGYVIALILAESLWVPRMVLITAGGLVFGPLLGGLLSVVADLAAGSLFYGLASGLARPAVEVMLRRHQKTRALVDQVALNHGVAAVALLRVCPLAHYTAFSYACGLSSLKFGTYLLGTFLGVLPGAAVYPFFGDAVLNPGSGTFWFAAATLVVFLAGTVWIGKKMVRSADNDRSGSSLRFTEK